MIGSWYYVNGCDGCGELHESIADGTTSTSSQSKTTTWSQSLSNTVSCGLMFMSESVTYTVGHSVSNEVSQSYGYSESHTCTADCGNGTETNWFMYAWQMNGEEYVKATPQNLNIKACSYVCNNVNKVPQCPPGYCKDTACQTCIAYK